MEKPSTPVVINLTTFPQLSRAAEPLRKRIGDYVDTMRLVKRAPEVISLEGPQYDTLAKAVNSLRRRVQRDAPPLTEMQYDGIPLKRIALGRSEP